MSHDESNPSPASGQVTPTRSSDDHSQPPVTHNDWLEEAAVWWSQTLSEAGSGFRARLDEEAKHEAAETSDRVSPAHFKRHVAADLRAVIRAYACFVRLGMTSYEEAYGYCRLYANRRGSWGFSDIHLAQLHGWIQDCLGEAIERDG